MDVSGFITRVRDSLGLSTDLALAKLLDVSTGAIAQWRTRGAMEFRTFARLLDLARERAGPECDVGYLVSGVRSAERASQADAIVMELRMELARAGGRIDELRDTQQWFRDRIEAVVKRCEESTREQLTGGRANAGAGRGAPSTVRT